MIDLKKYPIAVIVETGKSWRAWPQWSVDEPGDGQVAWWAREVTPSDVCDGAALVDAIADCLSDVAFDNAGVRMVGDWDDEVNLVSAQDGAGDDLLACVDKAFRLGVLELAPGLNPITGEKEDT